MQQLSPDVQLRAIISDIAYACHADQGVNGKNSGDRAEAELNSYKERARAEGDTQRLNQLNNCRIAKDYCNQNTVAVVYIQNERTDRETREVIIGCRGTNPWSTRSGRVFDWLLNNSFIIINNSPGRRALTTIKGVREIMKDFPGYLFSITGHSLGGAVAEYVSRYFGIRGDGFNGAAGLMTPLELASRVSIIK